MFVCAGIVCVTQVDICREICLVWFGEERWATAPWTTVGPGVSRDKAWLLGKIKAANRVDAEGRDYSAVPPKTATHTHTEAQRREHWKVSKAKHTHMRIIYISAALAFYGGFHIKEQKETQSIKVVCLQSAGLLAGYITMLSRHADCLWDSETVGVRWGQKHVGRIRESPEIGIHLWSDLINNT